MSTVVLCPICNGPMAQRKSKFGLFWGCKAFPSCRGTRPGEYTPEPEPDPASTVDRSTPPAELVAGVPVADSELAAWDKANTTQGPLPEERKVKGSPEQEAIWHEIVNGTGHVVVKAFAGTGKSFTCRHAMSMVRPSLRVLYLAFSKAIVQEFKADAPANAEVCTLNSIGFRVCRRHLGCQVDVDKVANIFDELYHPSNDNEVALGKIILNATEKLVGLCQGYLIDAPTQEELLDLADKHEVELTAEIQKLVMELVPKILQISRERTTTISFNDQMWLPIVLNLPMPKYDLIFVDEAQDLNTLQHVLVHRLLARRGRVVVVGDDNQAIFGFRGSDVDSIPNLTKILEKHHHVTELPLSVSRRCAKNIIAYAQQWVPDIQALPDAPDGEVVHGADIATVAMTPGNMVVCRTNAPLTSIAMRLIRNGIKAIIRGRDIGRSLINLIKRLRSQDINDLLLRLEKWEAKEIAKVSNTRRAESQTQKIQDQAECIRALAEGKEHLTDLIAGIEAVFADFEPDGKPRNAVILSSIHRAKGLESETVIWALPSIEIRCRHPWQQRQEIHLKYVAATRAKLRLILADEKKTK